MRAKRWMMALGMAGLLVGTGAIGCDDDDSVEDSAERAAEKGEDAAERAADKVEDAGDRVKDKVD